jgi:hypothetical protein
MATKTSTASKIRFTATLLQPAELEKGATWTFLLLPKDASAKLPTRGSTTVEGTLNGIPFRAIAEPDGQRSHWLRIERKLRESAGAKAGDEVTLEITQSDEEMEATIPPDLKKALDAAPATARAAWSDTTALARRDWIAWVVGARQEKTRAHRIEKACDMLAKGKKRVCCFDRSGFYSKEMSAPKAAE